MMTERRWLVVAAAAVAGVILCGVAARGEEPTIDPNAPAEPAGIERLSAMNRVLSGTVVAPSDPVAAAMARVAVEMVRDGQDIMPILQLYAQRGGGGAQVDVTAARDAAQGNGGIKGHFARNWGKYLVGTGAAAGAHLIAEHNGGWGRLFGGGDSDRSTVNNYNYTAGRDIVQGDGNTTGAGPNSGEGSSSGGGSNSGGASSGGE